MTKTAKKMRQNKTEGTTGKLYPLLFLLKSMGVFDAHELILFTSCNVSQ